MGMIDLTGSVVALLIVSVLSIILNSFCLHVIRKKRTFREKPSTVFLVNLLLTHLLQGVIVLPMYIGKSFKVKQLFWMRFFSNGFLFSYLLAFYGVCFGVLIISMDRFLATYLMTKYKSYVNFRNATCVVLGAWLYNCILCIIPFIPEPSQDKASNTPNAPTNTSMVNVTASVNLTMSPNATLSVVRRARPRKYFYTPQDEWTVFMLFVNAVLPFLLIVVCYTYIIIRIKKVEATQVKYEKQNKTEGEGIRTSSSTEGKVKGFKKYKEITYLTLVLCVVYFLLWTPSIIYYTILKVCEENVCFPPDWNDSPAEKHIVYIIKFLSYLNAFFSPVIYCLRHPEMKKEFVKLKHRLSMRSNPIEMGQDNLATSTSGF